MELNKLSQKQKEHLAELRLFHIGRKRSENTRKKISNSMRGKYLGIKRPKHSEFMKNHHPKGMLGKKHKEITKEKMAISHKGIHQSYMHRKKRGLTISKEKNPNWKGGITALNHQIRKCFEYRQWRSDIFTRDNFICVLCGKNKIYLEADHFPKSFANIMQEYNIKSLKEALFCEELWNINNGRTLCKKCHRLTL